MVARAQPAGCRDPRVPRIGVSGGRRADRCVRTSKRVRSRDDRLRGKGIAGSRPSGRSLSGNAIGARVARFGAGALLSLGRKQQRRSGHVVDDRRSVGERDRLLALTTASTRELARNLHLMRACGDKRVAGPGGRASCFRLAGGGRGTPLTKLGVDCSRMQRPSRTARVLRDGSARRSSGFLADDEYRNDGCVGEVFGDAVQQEAARASAVVLAAADHSKPCWWACWISARA